MPAKRFIAKIANIRKMITMTKPTLAMAGTDVMRASINVFMEELCDRNLKGRKIRSNLSTLRKGMFTPVKLYM